MTNRLISICMVAIFSLVAPAAHAKFFKRKKTSSKKLYASYAKGGAASFFGGLHYNVSQGFVRKKIGTVLTLKESKALFNRLQIPKKERAKLMKKLGGVTKRIKPSFFGTASTSEGKLIDYLLPQDTKAGPLFHVEVYRNNGNRVTKVKYHRWHETWTPTGQKKWQLKTPEGITKVTE